MEEEDVLGGKVNAYGQLPWLFPPVGLLKLLPLLEPWKPPLGAIVLEVTKEEEDDKVDADDEVERLVIINGDKVPPP